ncbi:hypothetical protein O7626_02705 [Micromonospora sp. WMMD1102]|uniref:hypothetical protein n=1 Tax=Micromonospora sp. WMMD1102 TaxID=3016105 RepID=UPI0024157BD4|nr:hypothetical protein [Micromonospora sp. WMMD1102]MDG4784853.1 hypothetical protein [Micromonospora sp. WMMD1102]
MSVRRGATWLGTVGLLAGAAVALAPAPARAEGEQVKVRAPNSISAGGSAASVTVNVSMRGGDCVNVRTALAVQLPGLTADRVEVRVPAGRDWRRVPVSAAGDGLFVTERTAPQRPELCARKNVSSRYRVNLAEGVPGGRVTLVAEAYAAGGRLLGRGGDAARVTGRTGKAPQRTPGLVTASATPQATEAAEAEPSQEVAAALPVRPAAAEDSGGSLGLGGMVMVVGVVMVGIGIALIVLLVRRSRAERARAGMPSAAAADPTGAEQTARIVLLGAEPTTRIPPTGADPTTRIPPAGPVFRSATLPAGPPPATAPGPLPQPATPAPASPPAVPGQVAPGGVAGGDQTLILPVSATTPRRPRGTTPSRPADAAPVPPRRAGSVDPAGVPAEQTGPDAGAPADPPSTGGPDATLILPPSRRPPR